MNPKVKDMTSFIVMDVLEKANEMQRNGINIIHMEVGEPDFDLPECIKVAALDSINNGNTHYTHSLGKPQLRKEISALYKREYNIDVNIDSIVVTSGSSPAILLALMLICENGGEVILSNPGYSCYANFVLACGGVPVEVNLNAEDGFQFDVYEVKKAITSKTRAIFINSPMNPTGTLLSDSIMKELTTFGIPILSDEIYHGLVYGDVKAHSILEFTENAFVFNGFSKRFAMTGLRLGYLIFPYKYSRLIQTLQQNLFICAPSTAQDAGIAALRYADNDVINMRKLYNERRIFLIKRLKEIGFNIATEPQGAFYVFADARKFTNDVYKFSFEILEKAHVGITPGTDFGSNGEGFVRFSYANSLDNIGEAMNRIESFLKK